MKHVVHKLGGDTEAKDYRAHDEEVISNSQGSVVNVANENVLAKKAKRPVAVARDGDLLAETNFDKPEDFKIFEDAHAKATTQEAAKAFASAPLLQRLLPEEYRRPDEQDYLDEDEKAQY